ncbi:MAG: hypothetical protein HRU22_15255, partial [Gammaproteobacteria bacterium]|nr:hypothetical protein [Gammaproteobacteria bacterium]
MIEYAPPKLVVVPPTVVVRTTNAPAPQLEPVNANFHIFDDICTLNNVRADYRPMKEAVIARLDPRYQHQRSQISQYIELNLYGINLSTNFKQRLIKHINLIHSDYIAKLGIPAKREITLNIVVTPNRRHYDYYVSRYYEQFKSSLGVHFGFMNIAFVDYQGSDDKALKTAIHEAVHALNIHILGKTPRMFNEGIAQLYAHSNINKQGRLSVNVSSKDLERESYPLMQFFDNEQWLYLEQSRLYASSWAWMRFMHSNAEGMYSLIHFMKNELKRPCEVFSADESYTLFQEKYNM